MDINQCSIDALGFFPKLPTKIWRWDKIHSTISGNKWFKLLGYEQEILADDRYDTVITFGGAYSNHLHACAHWASLRGYKMVAIVRGEEYEDSHTPTLHALKEMGVINHPVNRTSYRNRETDPIIRDIIDLYPHSYVIPEGGEGVLGEKGFQQLKQLIPEDLTHVCVSVGTGTTLKGLRQIIPTHVKILGFASFKNMDKQFPQKFRGFNNIEIIDCTCFGKFGQYNDELISFLNEFYRRTEVPLDIVYTSKMMKMIQEMNLSGYFSSEDNLLIIHTGGLQGNRALESKLVF